MEKTGIDWNFSGKLECRSDVPRFKKGVDIWKNKPYILNKRLSAVSTTWNLSADVECPDDILTGLLSFSEEDIVDKSKVLKELETFGTSTTSDNGCNITLRKLVSRNEEKHSSVYELVIEGKQSIIFHPILGNIFDVKKLPTFPMTYKLNLDTDSSNLIVHSVVLKLENISGWTENTPTNDRGLHWFRNTIIRKIVKWATENDETRMRGLSSILPSSSLVLISEEEYTLLYQELKRKYAPHLVANWTEKTDPQKFVFEDIAIATYLLLLWKGEREEKGLTGKQSFVDLGCGNGLLVYILSSEGHNGLGLDLRKRNIWDSYGEHINLKECAIVPSKDTLFPDYDWLIGNHSDELTPWIVVMAARSSYNTRFFVLPCCAHDFNGKFQKAQTTAADSSNQVKSQYQTYLGYVKFISDTCGFVTQVDKLRIPSTKRVCLVGANRNYDQAKEAEVDKVREELIASKCGTGAACSSDDGWAPNFKVREKIEVVRNCSKVDAEIKKQVVCTVFEALLNAENASKIDTGEKTEWRQGGTLHLNELAKLLSPEILNQLKKECGGIQTLLRNHAFIFRVNGGEVTIRNYANQADDKVSSKRKRKGSRTQNSKKTRLCWFHATHPDGCPVSAADCNYLHDN